MLSNLYVLILAGGKGIRLWPKSKKFFPKHFLSLRNGFSLLQETYGRILGFVAEENIFMVTLESQRDLLKTQIPKLREENLIVEPEGKNTLACILLGEFFVKKINPRGILAVLPSDHFIKPRNKFLKVLREAKYFVENKNGIVTIGIKPKYPETGYGYIKIRNQKLEMKGTRIWNVERFMEKPDLEKAKRFLEDRTYFWNTGIFVFQVGKMLEETKKYQPAVYKEFKLLDKIKEKNFYLILRKIYKNIPSLSFDHAILEKAKDIYMVKADFSWFDLGSWESIGELFDKDKNKNVRLGENVLYETRNTIVFNEDKKHLIATLGLENLIIIHTPEVTLIYPKYKSQDLKKLIGLLEKDEHFERYL